MDDSEFQERIKAVRHFNRFFTRRIGVLQEGLLHSPYPLTESRVIWELANRADLTVSDLVRELGLNPGYLSRILSKFEDQGLVRKTRSVKDGRQRLLKLTRKGQEAFDLINARSQEEVGEMLQGLSPGDQERLLTAMKTIESVFSHELKYSGPFFLRPHQPGDMGWVTHRHGVLYAREYGWDDRFEALVAGIVSEFITNFDPARERCWMAEINGRVVGSVFVVQAGPDTAKLRLLLVEPTARDLGLGNRLVLECIRFAREKGYRTLTLWTNSVLAAAIHIYRKHGFTLVREEAHHSFGHDLMGQYWELSL